MFKPTRWSLILNQAKDGKARKILDEEFNQLIQDYRDPILKILIHKLRNEEHAEDVAQDFFHYAFDKELFHKADPVKGRFRDFIKGCLNNFLLRHLAKESALKRGSGRVFSLEEVSGDHDGMRDSFNINSVDKQFDKEWANAIVKRALEQLKEEYERRNKKDLYQALHKVILDEKEISDVKDVASNLGISYDSFRTSLSRMKKRLRTILSKEILKTIEDPSDLKDELRWLMACL